MTRPSLQLVYGHRNVMTSSWIIRLQPWLDNRRCQTPLEYRRQSLCFYTLLLVFPVIPDVACMSMMDEDVVWTSLPGSWPMSVHLPVCALWSLVVSSRCDRSQEFVKVCEIRGNKAEDDKHS